MTELPVLKTGTARQVGGQIQPIDEISIPFALIEGARPGPSLLVTAGVHGSELCSIEAARRLMTLDPADLRGTLLVFPVLNISGFRARSIYTMPEDGKNLNRQFPGDPNGTASERLAYWLSNTVFPHFDAYLDLHGGDLDESLLPFTIYNDGDPRSLDLAKAFGLDTIVAGSGTRPTTVGCAAQMGLPAITAEVGANGIWTEEGVELHVRGVMRVMAHMQMHGHANEDASSPEIVRLAVPTAQTNGLWYPAKKLGDSVSQGEKLGDLRDFMGNSLSVVSAEVSGKVLYQLSSLWVNKGEQLLGLAQATRA